MTRYTSPACPQDAAHGSLLDWPTATAAFYCPHLRHTGGAFYTTDLAPVSRGTTEHDLARGLTAPDSRDVVPPLPEAPIAMPAARATVAGSGAPRSDPATSPQQATFGL